MIKQYFSIRALFSLGTLLFFSTTVLADSPSSAVSTARYCKTYETPEKFVAHIGQEVINTLTDKEISNVQKTSRFTKILDESFDVQYIGRFVLGRNYQLASPSQRTEYYKLFDKMLKSIYSDRFDNYSGETLTVTSSKIVSNTDSVVIGKVQKTNGAPPVKIEWRIRSRDTGCRIIDILVEGVSMSLSQRQDFNAYIQQNGGQFQALLEEMQRRYGNE